MRRVLAGDQTPASLSRSAMTYLRGRTGDKTVFITDSLSMAATTKAKVLRVLELKREAGLAPAAR